MEHRLLQTLIRSISSRREDALARRVEAPMFATSSHLGGGSGGRV